MNSKKGRDYWSPNVSVISPFLYCGLCFLFLKLKWAWEESFLKKKKNNMSNGNSEMKEWGKDITFPLMFWVVVARN